MIKFEKPDVWGWEHAIRGMRNPLNSWERSDSYPAVDCGKCGIIDREGICHPKEHDCTPYECYAIGDNDKDLMTRLIRGGAPHRKFLRQIFVSVDITAPLYWWKEFDTYKVGTTANSCSTMHKIQAKEFTFEDFSCEHLDEPTDTIKKAYFLLENLWESYMNSGKVNPVAGIFLGKNNYGYQDKTEYVLTPNQQNDNDYSADEIRERYIASDQQKRLSASNSDEDTSD